MHLRKDKRKGDLTTHIIKNLMEASEMVKEKSISDERREEKDTTTGQVQ